MSGAPTDARLLHRLLQRWGAGELLRLGQALHLAHDDDVGRDASPAFAVQHGGRGPSETSCEPGLVAVVADLPFVEAGDGVADGHGVRTYGACRRMARPAARPASAEAWQDRGGVTG